MNIITSIYLALLFIAFVPGVLVTLPKGGNKMTVVAVHAFLFAAVWHLTHKFVWRMSVQGFQNMMPMKKEAYQDAPANPMNIMMNPMNVKKEGYQTSQPIVMP